MSSILNDIKKMLGIDEAYEAFDVDIIIHINTAFTILNQIGVGPKEGFSIKSKEETWDQYIQDTANIDSVKTYVYLRVKSIFDAPSNSFLQDAMKRTMDELEWRLNIQVDRGDDDDG